MRKFKYILLLFLGLQISGFQLLDFTRTGKVEFTSVVFLKQLLSFIKVMGQMLCYEVSLTYVVTFGLILLSLIISLIIFRRNRIKKKKEKLYTKLESTYGIKYN